ncbi:hypothetical protein OHT59_10835 [Streptomyces sp. NBC_00243]|uniref:hypothetical protein n=1 Tax=Streptomyces sp. NBC_00243 TaxID=2975688 RepID=UPI002DDB7FE5|nr:hypothetical protein [Streptomyces sp. NBC_00243]WRZ18939.1 hypothetical protein OHT59_10835 [Streptomyces sp. NBC_00243]
MRVRIKFRYRADTGEVELFQVDDLQDGPALADHDARHHQAAVDVARVVENGALVEELHPGAERAAPRTPEDRSTAAPQREQLRDQ